MTFSVYFQRTDVLTELERSKRVFMQESTNCARHMAWVSTLIFTKVCICVQDCITSQASCGFSVKKTLGRLFCDVHRYFLLAQQQYGPGVRGPYFGQHQQYIFLAWVVSFPSQTTRYSLENCCFCFYPSTNYFFKYT